ncbi:MAG: PEFG-CTERM sorting domain-containing protein [Nitrosarchaeum sp.]|nr:PEFG-CTERM sorting domain-containing protein [Nitrosarchaeum sp.]
MVSNHLSKIFSHTVAKIVPEFGTIAMIILSVALVSIIGLTARSRLSIRL